MGRMSLLQLPVARENSSEDLVPKNHDSIDNDIMLLIMHGMSRDIFSVDLYAAK